jgi:hypothetical protein
MSLIGLKVKFSVVVFVTGGFGVLIRWVLWEAHGERFTPYGYDLLDRPVFDLDHIVH